MGYKEKSLIERKSLKIKKDKSVQEYTDEFHKKELILYIRLHTQETLMKYLEDLLNTFVTLYLCLVLLTWMNRLFKQLTLKQENLELVYHWNQRPEKREKPRGQIPLRWKR